MTSEKKQGRESDGQIIPLLRIHFPRATGTNTQNHLLKLPLTSPCSLVITGSLLHSCKQKKAPRARNKYTSARKVAERTFICFESGLLTPDQSIRHMFDLRYNKLKVYML